MNNDRRQESACLVAIESNTEISGRQGFWGNMYPEQGEWHLSNTYCTVHSNCCMAVKL